MLKMTLIRGLATIAVALMLIGCGQPEPTPEALPTATATALPTQAILAPTLPPATATPVNLAPTALPAPTEIAPPTAAPADPNQTSVPGDPGAGGPSMTLNPGLGVPGDTVIASGSGFVAGETITFHWNAADSNAATGPVYFETTADANGVFSVGLIIPPAAQWPGGAPKERDLFQLRVTAPSLGFGWLFYNFTYVIRFDPQALLPTVTPAPPTPTATATP